MNLFVRHFKSIFKYIASFFKREWELNDYPIEVRKQNIDKGTRRLVEMGLTVKPWDARIIKWYWMSGSGDTIEEAYEELQKSFHQYKNAGNKLPRPGTNVEIKFAETDEIEKYDHIAEDFFRKILNMNFNDILFISDESSLYDFCLNDDLLSEKIQLIKDTYGIDLSEDEGLRLTDIFRKIEEGKHHITIH